MKKKILVIALIVTGVFIAGCGNKNNTTTATNKISSEETTKTAVGDTSKNTTETTSADTSKDNTTSGVNDSNTSDSNNTEANANTAQREEPFYGEWVIKAAVGYGRAGSYSEDDIKSLIGKTLSFSKEQSSCFGDEVKYLDNTVQNPTYKKSILNDAEFTTDYSVPISTTTINGDSITQIEVVNATGASDCTFFIKDDNTLILSGGGTFFELDRIK